ncbi:homogentisate 1,2-dioxygenase [Rozella allomycis CSF55]|uniref:homogentisate 1,2-dioxygenase n=1 Tax=Rozella allomycis (strain CSF55) TaxID=988480 RepID=A0A075B0J1_ROZAC|nr:RmlC-like jelly roll fold domain-containing protein [Rozella allomycis CSF55]RKP20666.1 homogentisate 1,2-dioxygenase [Rozella allomycis CSF55]|eukprot:EPZ36041.1 RmlC-like jelly roll fold domain-containing protein [Rozella allomycis CSF55]
MSFVDTFKYNSGFGNEHCSEAIVGALPKDQNTPQVCPFNLYAEQLSGTAFTAPRAQNQKTWLYRIRPSVSHLPFQPYSTKSKILATFTSDNTVITPNQLRWSPFELNTQESVSFVDGLYTIAGAGDASLKSGVAFHVYMANCSMTDSAYQNSDGDFLFVPQEGTIVIQSELGFLTVAPNEIAVIPRGIRFSISLPEGLSRGYVLEVFNGHFELPELGPIGANGLAHPRHFLYPTAAFEEKNTAFKIYNKFLGQMFVAEQNHSPFNVVAWHGNYSPYKYDLSKFNTDPSLFTVLTCKSNTPGTAVADFVIFPPRWAVQENTFRPPYFHRNCMSEFMGLIKGEYEAKKDGFLPGGASLHNCMTPHGPDAKTTEEAMKANLKPVKVANETMAFMFESCYIVSVTKWAFNDCQKLQNDYHKAWIEIPSKFANKSA